MIAVGTVHGWLLKNSGKLERIIFVLFDEPILRAFEGAHRARRPIS